MTEFRIVVIFALLISSVSMAWSFKVLMMTSPLGSKSHNIFMIAIAKGLTSRGHQVTLRCANNFVMEKVDNLTYETFEELFKRHKQVVEVRYEHFAQFMEDLEHTINSTYTDPRIMELINEPINPRTNKTKYDVVIFDELIHGIFLPLAHRLGVPSISAIAFMQPMATMWNLNVPHPISYANYIGFKEPLSLFDRTRSFLVNMFYICYNNFVFYPNLDASIKKFIPNLPSLYELSKNISFVFYNSHPSIQDRLPSMPYVADIGCIHCRPSKPLPLYLERIMQSSGDNGVIYFSMGSYISLEFMPNDFTQKLLQVLGNLPQIILWKSDYNISVFPKNFRQVKWIPQQDLLAHPKLRLIINNGGLLSTQEAAYHGTPILGFPIFGDHPYAMQHAKRVGYGEYLDFTSFTAKQLRETITKMLHDPKYKNSAERASVLIKDRPVQPVELAAYWVEYVVKHKGAHHLKSNVDNLYWHQYFLLDVLFLIAMCSFVFVIIVWYFTLHFLRFSWKFHNCVTLYTDKKYK